MNITHLAIPRIDDDAIATTYDERYKVNKLEGVARALRSLAQKTCAERILEVGCGTGRWLAELSPVARCVHGLDISINILRELMKPICAAFLPPKPCWLG